MIPPTYPTCPRCEQVMAPGTSCCDCPWRQDGRVIPATTFGAEPWTLPGDDFGECHTPRGGTHHYGCAREPCPGDVLAVSCTLCPPLEHGPYAAATAGPVQ